MNWQPITTAPKDGTKILAYGTAPGGDPDRSWQKTDEPQLPAFCVIHWYESWYDAYVPVGGGLFKEQKVQSCALWKPGGFFHPTHWMPLPTPPNGKDGAA